MRRSGLAALVVLAAGVFARAASAVPPAEETTISGGRMEVVNKGEEVLFSDGVHLKRGGDTLKAQSMRTNRGREQVTATGDVRFQRVVSATETFRAWGRRGFYDTKAGSGWVLGNGRKARVSRSEVLSSTATRVVDVYADRIDFERDQQTGVARGAVEGTSIDPATRDVYRFWSDEAQFDGRAKTVRLTGRRPARLEQVTSSDYAVVTGDVITYHTDTQKLVSVGNAQAVFTDIGERGPGRE